MVATPAKWKVFSVICVAGSPTLCAPSAPTAVPGFTVTLSIILHHSTLFYIILRNMYDNVRVDFIGVRVHSAVENIVKTL